MLLRSEKVGTVMVVTLMDTKLDASSQDEINREIDPILTESSRIILDLHKVDFVDSSGCNVILRIVSRLRIQNGELAVCASRPRVRETFQLIGLQRTCDLYNTVEEGLKSLGDSGEASERKS